MFSNLNWYNVVVLVLVALFVFGDKLPQLISDGLRLLRNMRRMAQNATSDLSRELGTDIRIDDLNPRTFVRRHVLSDEDQQKLMQPLRGVSDDLRQQTRPLHDDLDEVTGRANGAARSLRRTSGGSRGRRTNANGGDRDRTVPGSRRGTAAAATATGATAPGGTAHGETDTAADDEAAATAPEEPTRRFDDVI